MRLSLLATTATLENVVFSGNTAQGGAGGSSGGYAQGGALFTFKTAMTGTGLTFEGNVARAGSSGGGGIASNGQRGDALGGGACFETSSTVKLYGVTALRNQAIGGNAATNAGGGFGGALFGEGADVTVEGADIMSNLAQGGNGENGWLGSGGGIMTIHSTLTGQPGPRPGQHGPGRQRPQRLLWRPQRWRYHGLLEPRRRRIKSYVDQQHGGGEQGCSRFWRAGAGRRRRRRLDPGDDCYA